MSLQIRTFFPNTALHLTLFPHLLPFQQPIFFSENCLEENSHTVTALFLTSTKKKKKKGRKSPNVLLTLLETPGYKEDELCEHNQALVELLAVLHGLPRGNKIQCGFHQPKLCTPIVLN